MRAANSCQSLKKIEKKKELSNGTYSTVGGREVDAKTEIRNEREKFKLKLVSKNETRVFLHVHTSLCVFGLTYLSIWFFGFL